MRSDWSASCRSDRGTCDMGGIRASIVVGVLRSYSKGQHTIMMNARDYKRAQMMRQYTVRYRGLVNALPDERITPSPI